MLRCSWPGILNNEFQLMDENRCDGVKTDVNGFSYVSPFDYLVDSQRADLIALYQAQVVAPFFSLGQAVNAGQQGHLLRARASLCGAGRPAARRPEMS